MSGQHQTISQCFLSRASADASKTAWRRKERGVWHTVSWAEALHEVSILAQGLADNGLRRGDSVLMLRAVVATTAMAMDNWLWKCTSFRTSGSNVTPVTESGTTRKH